MEAGGGGNRKMGKVENGMGGSREERGEQKWIGKQRWEVSRDGK